MGHTVVRYGVKKGSLEENRALLAEVFEELHRASPEALEYLVLELDGGDFIHVVREGNGASPLPGLAAFKAFVEHHADRRSTPICRSPARIVGNYRMLPEPNRE